MGDGGDARDKWARVQGGCVLNASSMCVDCGCSLSKQ